MEIIMNRIYKCFPGGKFKVLTLSYDDGKIQDRRLVDIFNKNGIRATFNVNSQLTDMIYDWILMSGVLYIKTTKLHFTHARTQL